MNILLLGSGGREHALAWKINQSPLCKRLYIAPGNAGTLQCGENIPSDINDFEAIAATILEKKIGMVVIGPEEPLVNGITDFLEERFGGQLLVVGPGARGASLEGSKQFAKEFMYRHGIPTAAYKSFTAHEFGNALEFLNTLNPPFVLKADGLAAGKGVIIASDRQEAEDGLKNMLLNKSFGKASEKVVIEEFLDGIEVSVFVATDGKSFVILPEAKDYKRIGEGDTGPNTGGMGAVSPVPFADKTFLDKVTERIVKPTIEGLNAENISYKGFIFIGLMNVQGEPYVIEYNVRMGDPETEAIIPRINSDLVELLTDIATKNLHNHTLEICPDFAVTVMLVSGGYPGKYQNGYEISGIDDVVGSYVFMAGAKADDEKITTNGGRVLALTTLHPSLQKARDISMKNAGIVDFKDKSFRRDIGLDVQK